MRLEHSKTPPISSIRRNIEGEEKKNAVQHEEPIQCDLWRRKVTTRRIHSHNRTKRSRSSQTETINGTGEKGEGRSGERERKNVPRGYEKKGNEINITVDYNSMGKKQRK